MSSERPAKRVRQACEPCRRKKSRCPGEKPVCSHCERLRQTCYYAAPELERERDRERERERDGGETERDRERGRGRGEGSFSPTPGFMRALGGAGERVLEDRLKYVESQLAEVLANQSNLSRSASSQVQESPVRGGNPNSSTSANIHRARQPSSPKPPEAVELPPWEEIVRAAETYLLYCDCQPLPLFHKPSFLETLKDRQTEVLFALLALTLRFSEPSNFSHGQEERIAAYLEAARTICCKKMFDGVVDLATIQTLTLLTLVDFTNGHTKRASIFTSMAMSLAQNASLTTESPQLHRLPAPEKEERRRCFWSLFLLKRLHGADFIILDFAAEENFPWYPETTGTPPNAVSAAVAGAAADSEGLADKGIVAYAIQLSSVFFKTTRYAWRRGTPSPVPPWNASSEYTLILASQMEFETRMPFSHRFAPAKFSSRPLEELDANRDYWGPWLFVQFLYHANLCLLTHPLLMSLRLRSHRGVLPEIFLQSLGEMGGASAEWVVGLVDMVGGKGFRVTDPFLGYCVAIVATIYLQESYSTGNGTDGAEADEGRRQAKRERFGKCLAFVRGFGGQWPHLGRIADKLQQLSTTVSSANVASEEPTRQNRKLLIDLGQFFEILEYSSCSELPGSARKLFVPSLLGSGPGFGGPGMGAAGNGRRRESVIAETSVLPEPTRVERQEFSSTPMGTPAGSVGGVGTVGGGFVGGGAGGDSGLGLSTGMGSVGAESAITTPFATMMNYSEDELAVLAENFFHQTQTQNPAQDVMGMGMGLGLGMGGISGLGNGVGSGGQGGSGNGAGGGNGGGSGNWWNMRYM